ncbi:MULTISPECIES: MarR family winged helix-turn-helix transcriptional regulator [unclassified Pseudomonas]|jgi:DNA-binding MarR family transcriptional regulator|uniref:MarR family winged helix-turn-helix transcriptional regulator n=1 Tax=unclassified Pseudomonas TaxID=196821 RepID=UPI000B6885A8|nr:MULTISPECIES: MarR family transcriptional regulator [Pseudomonas]GLO54895.1 MarR family transcriptional regulator [Pseudomonas putida]MDE4540208.1 MarR family transcriptional regulator [Pseudomonas sp. ITEM 17296]SNT41281.1 transcriptional regulator, MarR family [Pseudomonas sp. LAMO17WK12:I8]SNY34113.1 transcriptional regulator, MarR family [Pseudomonas sp. LAMO17WK12:I11]SNY34994.1 transcriptional regulator, MarR family [Pseudomonas sp. LAMO17WK12:I12]
MSLTQRSVATELSFALNAAANRMVRLHKPFLEPLGLTFSQYLVTLELLNGSPQSVSDLCERLDMETGTLTPLLKRLEAAGVITRTRDASDERRVLIDLTMHARGMEDELRSITDKIRTACQLTPQGLQELHRTLEGLARPAIS